MGDRVLTPDEIGYVQRFVAHRKRWSKGWAHGRYLSLFMVVFFFGISAYSCYLAIKYVETDTLLLLAQSDKDLIIKSDLERAYSAAKHDASAICSLWLWAYINFFLAIWLLCSTLCRWNRHIQDNILEKLVNAMLSYFEEHGYA